VDILVDICASFVQNGRDFTASINPAIATTTTTTTTTARRTTTIPVAPVVDAHKVGTVVAGAPEPSAPPISGPGSPEYGVGRQ